MSKLSRTELKNIVKECLVEILSEGLASTSKAKYSKQSIAEGTTRRTKNKQQSQKRSYLDNIKFAPNNAENKKELMTVNLTSNPILNEMLADTKATTLQEQLSAEGRKGLNVSVAGDKASKIVSKSTPEELFGKNSSKWAALAFSD